MDSTALRPASTGQHEAVWQRGPVTIMVIARPAVWTDTAWFLRLLEQVL